MSQLRGCGCRLGSTVGTAKAAIQNNDKKKKQSAGFGAALTAASGRATMSVICPNGSMSLLPFPDKRNAPAARRVGIIPWYLLQRSLLHALTAIHPLANERMAAIIDTDLRRSP
jgi:hypothetical protein